MNQVDQLRGTREIAAGLQHAPVSFMSRDLSQDIRDRTFRFACGVARMALRLAPQPGVRCIVDQLVKAGTSVGANLEEAKAGSSRRDFVKFLEIALRESRETVYWLRICVALQLGPAEELVTLRGEGEQISRILGAIVVNTKRNAKSQAVKSSAVFAFCILNFALLLSKILL